MARTIEDRIIEVEAALEAGFLSEAARKRALENLNRAYSELHTADHGAQISHANVTVGLSGWWTQARSEFFSSNATPFELHQVRERHLEIFAHWTDAQPVRDLIALREMVKAAEIVKVERNTQADKVEAVRAVIVASLIDRKEQFVHELDMAHHFGGLHVYTNAHWVHGHKGGRWIRHFFYLRGKLTPLNMIIALAEQLEREKLAAEKVS